MAGGVRQLADPDRRRVAREHGLARSGAVELLENRALYLQVLEDRLDDQRSVANRIVQVGGEAHALERELGVLLRELPFLDPAGEVALVGVARLAQLGLVLVLERHVDAVPRRLLP